ncbi:hypothetical protein J1N35_045702 [Gossypium stocksii]|uniref:Reverse transcriptase domain-containing protein n=1 Tax=Gossypium stocksii TaxID=47602 RepID=A0A9D3UC15_9ROSI|nr:hypothetical protein J1N35_045702 [Gossypium stocksii]
MEEGMIEGFNNVILGMNFSHLQFADDIILFLKAYVNEVTTVKYTLWVFEIFSGLSINFNKSCIVGFDVEEELLYRMAAICKSKEDKTGCGGILIDLEGVARGALYRDVGSNTAEVAEIGAVKIALEMFASMNQKSSISLVIELGSPKVFSWCINKKLRPWSLHDLFSDIESAKGVIAQI